MGRSLGAAIVLGSAAAVAAGALSGASTADPRTPPAPLGMPAPFLGVAVIGSGDVAAALDAYGDVVDLRAPGPAGRGLIANPFERQAAGSVAADTGIVVRVAAGVGDPLPLWRADRIRQRYLRRTNVLRTSARIGGARVSLTDAVRGGALARRIEVRDLRERLRLLLGLNLSGAGACRPAGADAERGDERLKWRGRGRVSAGLLCALGASPGRDRPHR